MNPGPRSLKARALQWLAQREHSRAELRRKLLPHARAAAEEGAEVADAAPRVDALLDWLEANRYLSEERFAESRVHARASRYGNLRIRQELAQHGVALAPEAADALEHSEFDRARDVWVRKYGADAAPDAAARSRQARFLIGRGFSAEVVRRVLRAAGRPAPEPDES